MIKISNRTSWFDNLFYCELQIYFVHHLHCTTTKCSKGLPENLCILEIQMYLMKNPNYTFQIMNVF